MEFSEFIFFFTCVLPVELYTLLSCVLGLSKMSVKLLDNIQVMSCQYFFYYFMDLFFLQCSSYHMQMAKYVGFITFFLFFKLI